MKHIMYLFTMKVNKWYSWPLPTELNCLIVTPTYQVVTKYIKECPFPIFMPSPSYQFDTCYHLSLFFPPQRRSRKWNLAS